MKKILLPTDFSENAYNAVKYAAQLFKDEDCIFYLLNTYTPIIYDNSYLIYNATHPTLSEIYRDNSLRGLRKVDKRVKTDFPNDRHEFRKIASFNMLADEINEQVKEKEIDLVVMGTKGATGAEEILLGTHTVHAIKKAIVPLLTIPSGFEFTPLKDILFPTDYEVEYGELLQILKELVSAYDANLHILHVYFGKALTEEQETAKKKLGDLFSEDAHHFYSIAKKNVPGAINDFQEENNVDLLAMVNNKHSFFENLLFRPVINQLGFHIRIPFLVIPSSKKK